MLSRDVKYEADCLKAFTPPIKVLRPQTWKSGVIFASPHSGSLYPKSLTGRSAVPLNVLRRNEDAFIDQLFAPAQTLGAPLLSAEFPRCFVDVNRAPDDVPSAWSQGDLPGTARADAGLGVVPTKLTETVDIYKKPLNARFVRARLMALYHPYHDALQSLITEASQAFGNVLLIDCHSMPGFAPMGARRPDIILGDRFGVSCHGETIQRVESYFREKGYSVARNYPYAGGYVTRHYGKPLSGIEAVQIEINRDLYLNPVTLKPKRGYNRLAEALKLIIADIIDSRSKDILLAAQ